MANHKVTHEEFMVEVMKAWGDRWDYSQTKYVSSTERLIVTCKEHGDFNPLPSPFKQGKNSCPKCARKKQFQTNDDFIAVAKKTWGDRWDYSQTIYTGMRNPIDVICPKHGKFSTQAQSHINGTMSCKGCSPINERMSRGKFIRDATEFYGDTLDLSKTPAVIKNVYDNVTVTCVKHDFDATRSVRQILRGYNGCDYCSTAGKVTSREVQIFRAQEIWGERWDYSMLPDKPKVTEKHTFICREHGPFQQTLDAHLVGKVGCDACHLTNRRMTLAEFITKSQEIFGPDRYDYTNARFIHEEGKLTQVIIACPQHGEFTYTTFAHFQKNEGCVSCRTMFGSSAKEKALGEFVSSLGFEVELGNRKILNGKEIDIFIPALNVGIEFNGIYYHSNTFLSDDYHAKKYLLAKAAGIRLLQIWEDDWDKRRNAIERHIKNVLGVSNERKVYARNTSVVSVSTMKAREFFEENHIQGFVPSSLYFGLADENKEVVAMIALKKEKGNLVLTRYATAYAVPGGHSKLVSYVEKTQDYGKLITFADLTFSEGKLYEATGWILDGELKPDYAYVRGSVRRHKFSFRKANFKSDPSLIYVEGMTEAKLAEMNNIPRVFDAGKLRFIKPCPTA